MALLNNIIFSARIFLVMSYNSRYLYCDSEGAFAEDFEWTSGALIRQDKTERRNQHHQTRQAQTLRRQEELLQQMKIETETQKLEREEMRAERKNQEFEDRDAQAERRTG